MRQAFRDGAAVGLAGLFQRRLHQPHVAIGRDDVLRHPGLLVFCLQFGDQILVALRAPIGDDRHDALDHVGADALQHVGLRNRDAEGDRRNLALAEPELVDFFQAELGVRDRVGHEQQQIRTGRPDLLDQRRGVGERRRPDLLHDQLQAFLGEEFFLERLGGCDRCCRVVHQHRHRLRAFAGCGFGKLHQFGQAELRLPARGRRGLEDVFEAALGQKIRIGQSEHRQFGAFGDFGHRQREGAQIGSGRRHQIGFLRHHALRRVLGLFGGVAAIDHDQLQLGAAERLDAALRVDVLDAHLGAHAHHLARPGIDARQRHDQADLDLGRLLRARHRRQAHGGRT